MYRAPHRFIRETCRLSAILSVVWLATMTMSSAPRADGRLGPQQLRALVIGAAVETTTDTGQQRRFRFAPDGVMTGTQGGRDDSGRWWINRKGALCFQWNRFAQALKRCRFVDREGNDYVLYKVTGEKWHQIWKFTQAGGAAPTGIAKGRPPTGADGEPLLSGPNLRALMAGSTVTTESQRGAPLTIQFAIDGTLPSTIDSPRGMIEDNGRWWMNPKGGLCWQWTRFGEGKLRCVRVKRNGDRVDLYKMNGESLDKIWTLARRGPNSGSVRAEPRTPIAVPAPPVAKDSDGPVIALPPTIDTSDAIVTLAGRVSDRSQIVEVTVNRRPVTVSPDGTFTVRRGVPQGKSAIAVEAMDEWGNRTRKTVAVTRKAPPVQQALLRGTEPKPPVAAVNPFADIHFGRYHALVIGNNDYRTIPDLRTAEGDARAVADLLKREYGFDVTLLRDATRADVIGGLAKMRATLKPDDSLLIYYAGHGVLDDIAGQGYWLPVDAEEGNPTNWISTSDITTMLRVIRAKHILVVADSCYSGTLVRAVSGRIKTADAQTAWVKRMAAKRARTALVSGGLEPVEDGTGSHSVFAKAFLDALAANKSVLAGEALFNAIKRPVVLNADQTPQYSDIRRAGHDGGDFLFVRKGG